MRMSCLEKMEECNLSPFSSPGKNSLSPRYRKTLSPYAKEDREKPRPKGKPKTVHEKQSERRKIDNEKRSVTPKQKIRNE